MDTKLATYRNKKRKKEMIESAKSKLKEFLLWNRFVSKPQETNTQAEVGYGSNVKKKFV